MSDLPLVIPEGDSWHTYTAVVEFDRDVPMKPEDIRSTVEAELMVRLINVRLPQGVECRGIKFGQITMSENSFMYDRTVARLFVKVHLYTEPKPRSNWEEALW